MLLLALVITGIPVFGHGISIETTEMPPAVRLKASYSGGNEISGISIKIYPPGTKELYQQGKTDIHGHFSFTPDTQGNWTLLADDGMGHKKEVQLTLSPAFFESDEEEPTEEILSEQLPNEESAVKDPEVYTAAGIPVFYRIIFGLSIIFGLTGIVFGLLSRKKSS